MRKHLLLILMLTALFPWSLRAQTLTINDGTETNLYIPVYGYWVDMGSSYTETQFILPSGDLAAMVGSDITSLTFYANYSQDFGNASWDIYMQETNSTTLSSIASYSGNTRVYSGHLAVVSNQLVIEFDASYPYNGDNLLITFHKTQAGTCSTQYDSFYGVSATNGASAYNYSSSFTPQPFLPKVTFTYGAPPTCPKPTELAVSDITSAGATLSWTSSASNFVVAYGTGTDPDQMTTVNAATNSIALTGLNANTVYNAYVKAVCSETDESEWSAMKTFRTECAAIDLTTLGTIGFETSEGFVTGTNPSSPNCWTFGNMQSTSTTYIPYINNSSSSAYAGTNSLKLYAIKSSYTAADSAYAAMPEFSATNLSQYMLRFYARQGSTSTYYSYANNLVVGVMTDPMDMSTFVQVGSANVVGTTYAQYEVSLASYSGNGNYIAFLAAVDPESTASTRYAQYYVDNLEVMVIPSCFPVASVSFADVERTSMTINWTKNSNPAAVNTDYQVVLSTTPLDADGLATATPVDVLNATTYTATNLERNTLYYVYVRSACGGDDYSEWVEATQRTPDLGADCSVSSLEQTIGTGTSAIQYLPWSDYYNSTYSQQIYTAAEMTVAGFSAGYITKVAFQYALSASYTKTVTIYMGTTTDASFSSTSFKEVTAVTSATATTFNTAGAWYEFEFDTPFYWDGTSNIVVGAMNIGTNYPSSGTPTFYGGTTTESMALYKRTDNGTPSTVTGDLTTNRANIKITVCPPASACPEITNLAAVTTVHEATITWTPSTGDYVGRYEIIHSNVQLSQGELNQQYEDNNHHGNESVTAPTVTVSALDENTQYYIYISTVCDANSHDDGMSDWVEFSYKTKANCLTPVGLDATVNGKKDVTVTWANDSYDSEREIYVQESNFYWILATDDITEGGNIDIDINHSAVVVHNFDDENGITDDHAQITFSEAEINVLDHNKTYYFYVRNECGNGGAWVSTTFTTPDECPAVVNLEVSNETAHTALLTWDKGEFGEETEWKVRWGNNELYTTEQSFLVYGLAPETRTTVSVYAACDKNHGVFGTAAIVDVNTTAHSDEVQVGTGTSSANLLYTSYGNTYSQQIYTADELRALGASAGTILSVRFNYTGASSSYSKTQSIYMGNVSKSEFAGSSATDYVQQSDLTLVYGPTENSFQSGWREYELTTPFVWDGTSNLCVGVLSNSTASSANGWTAQGSSTSPANRSIYRYKDYSEIDIDNLGTSTNYGARSTTRPNIKLTFEAVACPKVTTFNVNNITTTTANVSWMPAGGEMTWNYVVSTSATLDEAALNAHTDASIIAYNDEDYAQRFVELTNLNPSTQYYLYVQTICDAETVSAWSAPYEFVTVATCPAPTALLVSNITNESVQLAWTVGDTESEWEVIYSSDNGANWSTPVSATTNPYTLLTGLSGNTDYQVKVKAVCSETDDSYYTPVVNFTTECDPISTFPYVEKFDGLTTDGQIPDCWKNDEGTTTNDAYKWSYNSSYGTGVSGGKCVRFDSFINPRNNTNFLKTPELSLPSTTMYLSFQYKNPTGGDFSVYISTDGGTTYTTSLATGLTDKSSWTQRVISLETYSGQDVVIVFGGTSNYGDGDARIYLDDVIVAPAGTFIKNGAISTADNWSGAEVPATTGYGYIAAEATVSADFTIADLNILEGGKVTVNNGATLTVTGTLTNNDEANLVINDGGQLVNASATKATVKKEITAYSTATGTDADGWYLIAAPITDAAASMVTTDNYDFYAHDEAAYMWRNYKVVANQTAYSWLTNGYGYLYANAANQTLSFAGTLAADDQKEIPLAYTGTGANTGWNLLGNHTAHNVTIESDFNITSVKVMDASGIDFTDRLIEAGTIAPCEGFFVKATEAGQHVTINPTSTAKSQEAPQGFIQLNLVDNNTPVFTDVAYITMEGGIGSENITFSEVSPQLYVPMNGVDYSVAVVDADLTVIPVGFKATANSSYTISLNLINAHFETVILRDLKTGIDTDLKAGNYVFNGDIDDAENRFNLILAVEAPEGIGENNEPFAYQSGSDIIFTDAYGTVQVMDVLGRVMSETRIDGAARISTRGLVSGTYVLRLLGNESVRTQKIVVK